MKTLVMSIIAVVLLTFCATGVTNAQQNGPGMGQGFGKGMRGMKQHRTEMIKKLNLTDQQQDKIADLKTAFQKSMVDLRADLKKNRIDMQSLKSKDNISRDEVVAAVEKVNKSRDAISLAVANHLFDVYQILTPEQRKIWKENVHGMGMHMGRRGNMMFGGCRF